MFSCPVLKLVWKCLTFYRCYIWLSNPKGECIKDMCNMTEESFVSWFVVEEAGGQNLSFFQERVFLRFEERELVLQATCCKRSLF